ncbi:MAG: hypothetical protein ACRBFS_06470 [Aureispira sp.]
MTLKQRLQHIKGPLNWLGIILDIAMLALTIFDLCWLMFDALYNMPTVQKLVDPIFPFYQQIHEDFYFYDGLIVTIFLSELLTRWAFSIYKSTYERWFFYPFIHWYDVLGCFPTGSFRILRLFRIVGLIYRLHRWQVIDLNNYVLFITLGKYYNIGIEEISDRVIIQVLHRAKEKVSIDDPLPDAIIEKVIQPHQQEIAQIVSQTVQNTLGKQYPQYRTLLQRYVVQTVQDTVTNNEEVRQIGRIPIVGTPLEKTLHQATSQIVFGVIDRLIKDAADPKNAATIAILVNSILEVLTKQQLQQTNLGKNLALDTIDLIIERVRVKNWKQKDSE